MINLDQLYNFREKIPNYIKKIFPKFIRRKINKKFFNYYFLPTNLEKLPTLNYPEDGNLQHQRNLVKMFNDKGKQTSFMTCPHLIELLLMKFKPGDNFNFLDIGGEKIDFYLDLKKKFSNVNYFLFNQKSMITPFYKIKNEFSYTDLHIINNMEEIFKKKYDFVNFGSCIQYIDNYEEFLKKITDISKCIFFSATHLFDSSKDKFNKHLIVKQLNFYPSINYNFFFNRKNFFKIFKDKKFDLIFDSQNLTDQVNYDNFKAHVDNIKYSDFLFIKR